MRLYDLYTATPGEYGDFEVKVSGTYDKFTDLYFKGQIFAYIDTSGDPSKISLHMGALKDSGESLPYKFFEGLEPSSSLYKSGHLVQKSRFKIGKLHKRWY